MSYASVGPLSELKKPVSSPGHFLSIIQVAMTGQGAVLSLRVWVPSSREGGKGGMMFDDELDSTEGWALVMRTFISTAILFMFSHIHFCTHAQNNW